MRITARVHQLPLDRHQLAAIVKEAGRIALGYFNRTRATRKADRTVVTEADRVVERFLRERCQQLLPGARFIGEETGCTADAGRSISIAVDPIDGTSAFVAGIPTWCVCLGLLVDEEPIAGAVYLPAVDELYLALGGTAWWNDDPLERGRLSNVGGDRFVVAYSGFHRRHRVPFAGKVRSLGSTAYHICLVARGAATGALLGRAHIWDLAAGAAVLHAAGGRLLYLCGLPVVWSDLAGGEPARDYVVASRNEDMAEVLALFQAEKR